MKNKNQKETHLRNKVNRTNMNNNTLFDTEFANEYEFEDMRSGKQPPTVKKKNNEAILFLLFYWSGQPNGISYDTPIFVFIPNSQKPKPKP